jgi:hypothetical protein
VARKRVKGEEGEIKIGLKHYIFRREDQIQQFGAVMKDKYRRRFYFLLYASESIESKRHDRLLFGYHDSDDTSPIIWTGIRQVRTGGTVLVKNIEMTGRSQTLPWWQWGKG